MAQYLLPSDLTNAVTTFQGLGVSFSDFTTAQLTNIIGQASDKIDAYCRDTHAMTNVEEYYDGNGTNYLRLRHFPLWRGLTTTVANAGGIAQGATSVTLADVSGLLPGQYIYWQPGIGSPTAVANSYVPPAVGASTSNIVVPLATGTPAAVAQGATVTVQGVDYANLVLPGNQVFQLPVTQLIIKPELGMIMNYTPLMFQQLGYSTVFPKGLPLRVRLTYGYSYPFPPAIRQTCLELCISTVQRNPGAALGGKSSEHAGGSSASFFSTEMTPDQQERLAPFLRGHGIY